MSDTAKADSLPVVGQRIRASQIVEGKVIERTKTLGRRGGYTERISVRDDRGWEYDFLSEDTDFEVLPEPMPVWRGGAVIRWTHGLGRDTNLPLVHVSQYSLGLPKIWHCTCGSRHPVTLIADMWNKRVPIEVLSTGMTETSEDQ